MHYQLAIKHSKQPPTGILMCAGITPFSDTTTVMIVTLNAQNKTIPQ